VEQEPSCNPAEPSENPAAHFDKLAEQAASGLKGDRELYLDVKQELRSHLEEKAEKFAHEGHAENESAELAKKSFGSPLDVAADLLNANKRRMKLRALFRLAFGALIVPVAILLALYLGYGRFARLEGVYAAIIDGSAADPLPALPLFGLGRADLPTFTRTFLSDTRNGVAPRLYWQPHRYEADGYMYYAHYSPLYNTYDERTYVEAMRLGEQIEPKNALYNVLLAHRYLTRGVMSRYDKNRHPTASDTDDLLDRRSLDLGAAELLTATKKPYLRIYQPEMTRKQSEGMRRPVLTEDYVECMIVIAQTLSSTLKQQSRYYDLSRKIPGCARILLSEGRKSEAEAVTDTWKPLTKLLLSDTSSTMTSVLTADSVGRTLAEQASEAYRKLGETRNAREAEAAASRLKETATDSSAERKGARLEREKYLQLHGPAITRGVVPSYAGEWTEDDVAPGRMHEYVIAEESVLDVLMIVFGLALLGALVQGAFWLRRMRGGDSVPLLLILPGADVLRAVGLGILLPMAVYWAYSRMPVVGGREYGLGVTWPRFVVEMLVLGMVMFWVPVTIVKRCIRRRCEDLDILVPEGKLRTMWGCGFTALGLLAVLPLPGSESLATRGLVLVVLLALYAALFVMVLSRGHELYYGTLARSLATVYAFSILLIALTIQPWLMYNEAALLRQDRLAFGHIANNQRSGIMSPEAKAAAKYTADLRKALEDK